MLTLQINAAHA